MVIYGSHTEEAAAAHAQRRRERAYLARLMYAPRRPRPEPVTPVMVESLQARSDLRPFPTTDRDRKRGFEGPFSKFERLGLDALHAQVDQRLTRTAPADPHNDPSSSSSTSSSSSDSVRRKKKKKKTKVKKERGPSRSSSQHRVIRVKATDMKLGQ